MLTLEEIRQALQDRVVTAVAQGAGLSHPTVSAVKRGDFDGVSKRTQAALSGYLAPKHPTAGKL